ncbi:MAG: Mur ligase family protein [Bacilli bacterium]|nr:Mur ligase family protein [Bacilli bacterium]MDD4076575.1 Mur ligase family protein [Bacilli bacterium]MDD4388712.1 Mur ligase family protein [Bacilli bacterium]
MEKFHLIGIKGTGMSALAGILKDLGCDVTGSDVKEEFFTSKKLKIKNIKVLPFSAANILEGKVYIASSCYKEDNVEIAAVKAQKLPFYYYHEFIEIYFKAPKIGISGTHGKTTTTSLVAKFFEDKKISFLIGDGTGKGEINSEFFIFEACEYKNHLLNYTFDYLIINNIDLDHPDFFKSIDDVLATFQKAGKSAKYLVINNDDEYCRKIEHPVKITFGMNNADICGKILEKHKNGFILEVNVKGKVYDYFLPFPGLHMIYNFLAALTVSYLNNIDLNIIQEKLLNYQRPSRRMEEYFYYDNVIIDDYAHHPLEIKMCLDAIRQSYPDKNIVVIFQPHTYSRTLRLKKSFKEVFTGVKLYLAKTFTSKRENDDKKLDYDVIKIFNNATPFHEKHLKEIKRLHNSVILFLGAGNIDKYIKQLL